ncbi:class I SAM-dependent methyltransferase [Paenibacillus turpanensis]|uniref:class I SAM-dependent methyltransferase n=1 Tax=Paenibacillus turpanensis TaxID=2689078 RepID=UPI0014082211|nr:class I SAM-dependent methyltransferase [Paenibacillus turpanensis]
MGFLSVLSFAHVLVKDRVKPGDLAIDATMGNGNDTLVLAKLVGHTGHVFGFDVQAEALQQTQERLGQHGLDSNRITLLLRDHADMLDSIPPGLHGKCAAVMFNLGYLPGADPSVITRTDSTLRALEAALTLLRPGGVITAVVYPGHAGGGEEADAVAGWASSLEQQRAQTLIYRFANQRTAAPYLIAVEKK